MKGRLVAILLTLLFSAQISIASSAIKPSPGATCTVLGKIQIIGKSKYTCIKSGKKLIWKQSAITSKATPTPTPTPSPIPSITATPTPTPTPGFTISPTPSASPTTKKSPQTQDDFKYRNLLFKAWQEQLDLNKPPVTPELRNFVDPNFPKVTLAAIQSGMQSVISSYGYLLKPNTKVSVIFSSSYDFEISAIKSDPDMYKDYLAEDPNWSRHTWRIDQYKQPQVVAGGTYPINNQTSYVIYFRFSTWLDDPDWRYLGAHETMHLMQWMINSNFPKVLPAWWIEGQAQQVEEVIGNAKKTTESIDEEMLRLKGHYGPAFKPEDTNGTNFSKMEGDAATRTEFGCELCGTDLIYSRGKLALDYLIANYGHEKVINYMKSLNTSNLWWQAFQNSFGISVEQFYRELQSFVTWYGNYYAST